MATFAGKRLHSNLSTLRESQDSSNGLAALDTVSDCDVAGTVFITRYWTGESGRSIEVKSDLAARKIGRIRATSRRRKRFAVLNLENIRYVRRCCEPLREAGAFHLVEPAELIGVRACDHDRFYRNVTRAILQSPTVIPREAEFDKWRS